MKIYKKLKNILTMAAIFLSCFAFGQAQKEYINYQGVASDVSNEIMASQTVSIGIFLRFGSPTATVLYSETHNTVTTDISGVFSLQIGTGTVNSGIYTDLEWGKLASYASIILNGTDVGTVALQSVPYANASGKATKMELNDLTNVGGSPTDGQVLKFDGTSWLPKVDDGSLWTEAGNNIYYNSGDVSIGDSFTYAKLNVSATTDDTPISISSRNSYSGDAAVVGITNEVFGDGGGNKTGFSSIVLNGDGTKYGYFSSIDQNGGVLTSNSYGYSSTIKNNSSDNSYGLYSVTIASGLGTNYGVFTEGEDKNYFSGNIETAGEINRPTTGNANLVPIAYGSINGFAGIPYSGSENFSLKKFGDGLYRIRLNEESFRVDYYTVILTRSDTNPGFISSNSSDGDLLVYTWDAAGTRANSHFSFAVFKE